MNLGNSQHDTYSYERATGIRGPVILKLLSPRMIKGF